MGLTFGDGPLSPRPPQTVNYDIAGPAHKLLMHPFPRRVRAEFAGRTVLDTRRGVLLHETAILPQLYVPEEDLDAASFTPTDHTTHCPFKGDATYRSLTVGDRTVENALWAYPEPTAAAPWLAGYAALYWSAADTWYDEDEQVPGQLTDPYHRVDARRSSRHVRVLAGDTLVAESHAPLLVSETGLPNRYYLEPGDVVVPTEPTTTRTVCSYKGEASYRSVRLPDGRELTDAAWGYPKPLPEAGALTGRLSFLHDELRTIVDGEPA
ncbi:DUF427 domain-containing protein [Pseudonocardia humida]|uniref:DUF427 domain-containing protein n=1 Tax=Pseudonocardia humida TaxID=2800819 RepID=A0ABT1A615_9PSEU|nr:DUF427 domain-containing protein [Pseudonocardia humida]MCO1658447.1 DUF427 domain-containing protein [Pseudonocardia humida]